MILILSSEEDLSTNDVIAWLHYYRQPFLRISKKDIIRFRSISIENGLFDIHFSINKKEYRISDFKKFWYRRSEYNFFIEKFNCISVDKKMNDSIQRFLNYENLEIQKLLRKYISSRSLNKFEDIFLNKLEVLDQAAKVGLTIPKTFVTNNKKELIHFLDKSEDSLITKNISQGIFIHNDSLMLRALVQKVTIKHLRKLPQTFHPMMFQEQINKLFELRIFFINDNFYASAIFSQKDEKTKIDFRNYNFKKPNRTPPFSLPKHIQEKLKKLFLGININSGSADMIVDENGNYIFLEVNPIGQFAQVSTPCNYYLEKVIAKELSNGY